MATDIPVTTTVWLARIHILRKAAVVDPQGNTVRDALHQLHFEEVQDVRIGKYVEVMLQASDEAAATAKVDAMCSTLLANPVIEQYTFTVTDVESR
jgi:phosphoribosylformylglycinamidine synthase PurS subunit